MPRPRKRIPRTSVFAAARSLPRLGKTPISNQDEDCSDKPSEIEKLFPPIPFDETDPIRRYMGWSQNDAKVLDFKTGPSSASLTVNHYDVWRLASCYAGGDWKSYARAFPITYQFQEIAEIHVLRLVEQGVYQNVRHSASELRSALVDLESIQRIGTPPDGQLFLVSVNSCRWGGFRRAPRIEMDWYHDSVEILIHCSALQIDDQRWDGWRLAFGPDAEPVLRAFDDLWPVNNWGVPDFEEWLQQFGHFRP